MRSPSAPPVPDLEAGRVTSEPPAASWASGTVDAVFRALVDHPRFGLCMVHGERFGEVNGGLAHALGYTPEEMSGRPVADFVLPDDVPALRAALGALAEVRERVGVGSIRGIRRDGTVAYLEVHASSATVEEERVVIATVVDATREHRIEEQVRQGHRMEAVGRLAGGVAHDFNNLLLVIRGGIRRAHSSLPGEHPLREVLDAAHEATDRAADLTRQLLALARRLPMRATPLDLDRALDALAGILPNLSGRQVEVDIRRGGDLHRVLVDPAQMEQIIMNLVLNARDAMPDGGTVVIETSNARIPDAHDRPSLIPAGEYVLLRVRDAGSGMDRRTLSHLFEPFYATKPAASGLGLSVVYGIVRQSAGFIEVDSEPGEGTEFRVYLPAHPDAPIAR